MKKYIMANWKMNKNFSDIPDYIEDLKSNAGDLENVVVCVPSVMLKDFSDKSAGKFGVGAQNCHFADHGAFTGEVSTEMVKSAGATYVLVGHSERRHIFGENDELLNKKLISVLNSGLKAVFCVGETLEELDSYKEVIGKQLLIGFENCPDFSNVIIAYEPVWAIGTGKVATVDDIVRVHTFIKELGNDEDIKNYIAAMAKNVNVSANAPVEAAPNVQEDVKKEATKNLEDKIGMMDEFDKSIFYDTVESR